MFGIREPFTPSTWRHSEKFMLFYFWWFVLPMLPNPLSEIGEELDKRQSKSDNVISVLPKEFLHWCKITEKQSLSNQATALDNQCLNPQSNLSYLHSFAPSHVFDLLPLMLWREVYIFAIRLLWAALHGKWCEVTGWELHLQIAPCDLMWHIHLKTTSRDIFSERNTLWIAQNQVSVKYLNHLWVYQNIFISDTEHSENKSYFSSLPALACLKTVAPSSGSCGILFPYCLLLKFLWYHPDGSLAP